MRWKKIKILPFPKLSLSLCVVEIKAMELHSLKKELLS
jgi:hypothetical protein